MSDLISRQAASEVIDAVFPVDPTKSEFARGIACGAALAKTYIEQLPSAQPEIVRCVDCKFYSRCTDHQGICTNRYMDGFIVPDWYCADGERREE